MMKLGVPVEGFDTAFAGDVPLGAGMSSSAALESCFAFDVVSAVGVDKHPMKEKTVRITKVVIKNLFINTPKKIYLLYSF